MNIYLVRHAHRNKPQGGKLDNGLSPKGKKQMKRLTHTLKQRLKEIDSIAFYSSPKKRCQETIAPLAKKRKTKFELLDALDVSEDTNLEAGVRATLKQLGVVKSKCVVLSVHGEWTEAFFKAAVGTEISLDKAGWAHLERLKNGKFRVLSVVPESLNR